MTKQIKLGDTTYELTGSVFTLLEYDRLFGNDIFQDLTSFLPVDKVSTKGKLEIEDLDFSTINITRMVRIITQVMYVMALPNMEEKMSYDRFVQVIPSDFLNVDSLKEIMSAITMLVPKNSNRKVPELKQ